MGLNNWIDDMVVAISGRYNVSDDVAEKALYESLESDEVKAAIMTRAGVEIAFIEVDEKLANFNPAR